MSAVRRQLAALACGVLLVAGLGGCAGFAIPTAAHTRTRTAATALAATPAPAATPIPAATRSQPRAPLPPTAVIRQFAEAYINWTAADVSTRMAQLARDSVGQARSEMALAAAEVRGDSTLRQVGMSNSGTVEAVAPVSGREDQYVVITQESTTAADTDAYQGLAPAWHLALASVTLHAEGGRSRWVVSRWQPES